MWKVILFSILLASCGQTYNSNSGDDKTTSGTSGIDTSSPAGQRLAAAYTVINNRCINCHTGYHNSWANLKSDAAWLASGTVVAGNTGGSSLISRLKNVGGDMPKLNPQIPEAEYQTLIDWVNGL